MIYKFDYISGTQTKMYIGGTFIDDVFHLQFEFNEKKGLAYGYGSQTYDAVLRGRQMVNGTFLLNFKTKKQLFTVLREELSKKYESSLAIENSNAEKIISFQKEPSIRGKIDQLSNMSPKALQELQESSAPTDGSAQKPIRSDLDFPPFDIIVEFGNVDAELYGHTRMIISGCSITSESHTVEVVGKPVSQMVRFFGKELG